MNLVTANQNQTMTHIQIANLLEKRNDKVKQSMDRLAEKGLIKVTPMGEVNSKGQSFTAYHVNERDSYVVVAQLSPEFTAKLVDYWMESKSNAQPKLPQTFAEALQLAADQAKQLELAAPKVAFHDTVTQSDNTYKYQEAGKKLQQRPNKFIEWMKTYSYLNAGGMPYQRYIEQGLFKINTGVSKSGYSFTQGRITTKGLSYFAGKLVDKKL